MNGHALYKKEVVFSRHAIGGLVVNPANRTTSTHAPSVKHRRKASIAAILCKYTSRLSTGSAGAASITSAS